ncbi:beta-lactamase class A [Anaerosolibacter carboniphilus]|uniref:Beta-lactamase class A n=1 Tax=Anaerosolibacter carboniphilus TaxID=1417629 RepID=A0A841KQS7_9FIRM|nr:SH3 domain-containing C40 family peptidase [Anaerosolibacter carboniphilus]MBB6215701.1 beta-lactamase class A [Anaerosolibacter carboniphilus]
MNSLVNEWAILKSTVVSVMKNPNFQSELADEGLYGMVVKIQQEVNEEWLYIETHYGYHGYMHKSHLMIDSSAALKWKEEADHVIIHPIVDVMAEPKYASYAIALLTRGAFVRVTGEAEDDWIQVILPQGEKGWIRTSFIKKMEHDCPNENEDVFRKKLVDTALSYFGTQYRWGGKSPIGIDCSGLCSMAYMLNGVIIYRDAILKDEYMKKIDREQMKPGDLLFFPGHVAMYMGEDRYVHATGREGRVLINSLNPDHDDYREDLEKNITGIGTIF